MTANYQIVDDAQVPGGAASGSNACVGCCQKRLSVTKVRGSSWIPGWRPSGRDEVPGDRLREDLPSITVLFMSSLNLVNLSSLIDDAKCYELVRRHRWPEGIRCPHCDSASVARHGHDDTQRHRQRYRCKQCQCRFDDLTGTVLAGHHQPLRVWVLCLYFMGLNLVWGFQCQAVSYSSLQCVHPYVRSEEPSRVFRGER
jgi:transposase-like protein